MTIRSEFRRLMRRIGYQPITPITPVPIPDWQMRRRRLFQTYNIDLVLDVGANTGQYAQQLRNDIHYKKKIISFEPLAKEYELLNANSASDDLWTARNLALGDTNEQQVIHVAGNSYSSSLLAMMPTHECAAPESKYIGEQTIEVRMLDSLFDELREESEHIYLKIDTQGFEGRVLKGAERSLKFIRTVQMEMSLVPLYSGEMLFDELCQFMKDRDYLLVSIETGFSEPQTGRLLQFDGIFHRY